jgi:hypothetical protein
MSVQLMPGLVSQSSSQSWNFGTEVYSYEQKKSGFIVIPEFRYYVSPDRTGAPHGLYVAALARVLMLTYDLEDTGDLFPYGDLSREDKRTVFGGGAVLGYQYATSGGFTLEAFAGPQFPVEDRFDGGPHPVAGEGTRAVHRREDGDEHFGAKGGEDIPSGRGLVIAGSFTAHLAQLLDRRGPRFREGG